MGVLLGITVVDITNSWVYLIALFLQSWKLPSGVEDHNTYLFLLHGVIVPVELPRALQIGWKRLLSSSSLLYEQHKNLSIWHFCTVGRQCRAAFCRYQFILTSVICWLCVFHIVAQRTVSFFDALSVGSLWSTVLLRRKCCLLLQSRRRLQFTAIWKLLTVRIGTLFIFTK